MFTGLIECMGTVISATGHGSSVHLAIKPDISDFNVPDGGSVAVDGACLTVEESHGSVLLFSAVRETLTRTTLSTIMADRRVNLERALKLGGRLDGHLVLGHVDAIGSILADTNVGGSILRTIKVPSEMDRFMAEKGSVTIDGISLTIAMSAEGQITVSLIPLTIKKTTMSFKNSGDKVNLECDVLARYIDRITSIKAQPDHTSDSAGRSLLNTMERAGF